MKLDTFNSFAVLTATQQAAVKQYISPADENSVVKGVPMSQLDQVKAIIKSVMPNRALVVKYRGPRYDAMALHCLKKDARSAAIYIK
jgi:hypothetical protein